MRLEAHRAEKLQPLSGSVHGLLIHANRRAACFPASEAVTRDHVLSFLLFLGFALKLFDL